MTIQSKVSKYLNEKKVKKNSRSLKTMIKRFDYTDVIDEREIKMLHELIWEEGYKEGFKAGKDPKNKSDEEWWEGGWDK